MMKWNEKQFEEVSTSSPSSGFWLTRADCWNIDWVAPHTSAHVFSICIISSSIIARNSQLRNPITFIPTSLALFFYFLPHHPFPNQSWEIKMFPKQLKKVFSRINLCRQMQKCCPRKSRGGRREAAARSRHGQGRRRWIRCTEETTATATFYKLKRRSLKSTIWLRKISPEVTFHLVSAVMQVGFNVERELAAVDLEKIVVKIEQLAGMLASDCRWKWRRDKQRNVVGRTAVCDHLPVEQCAVVVVTIVKLAFKQQIVAPEIGVGDQPHRLCWLQQLLDEILCLWPELLEHLQLALIAAFLL